jgi:hypothetical protein
MKNAIVVVLLSVVFVGASCKKSSNLSDVPKIEFQAMFPDTLTSGDYRDTIYIQFALSDGNADIGHDQTQAQNYDIYIRDMRVDTFTGYFFPKLDDFVKNPQKGIQGNCYFLVLGTFTFSREDSIHANFGDTTQYEIFIKDLAGNESNRITTGPVYIRPI